VDLNDLDRFLGIDSSNPLDARARALVEADGKLLDELVDMRKSKKLTQAEVAERMEITQGAVARVESGDRDPRLSTLRRYAMAVGALVSHSVDDDEQQVVRSPLTGSHAAHDAWPAPTLRAPRREPVDA
jgi:transcriptional regulator with XRE-family HTH domain